MDVFNKLALLEWPAASIIVDACWKRNLVTLIFLKIMDITAAQNTKQEILKGELTQEAVREFAGDLAEDFLMAYLDHGEPDLRFIDILGEIAVAEIGKEINEAAVFSLYNIIVESLCDDFTTAGVRTCNLVLARILEYVRVTGKGKKLHDLLNSSGLTAAEDCLMRYERLLDTAPINNESRHRIRKLVILSRVTIGADIAITSVLVFRLLDAFPQAELVLIGPGHLVELFWGIKRIRVLTCYYIRGGSLFDRTTTWVTLLEQVLTEKEGCKDDEFLVFDTDTRYTQLGLLPLLPVEYTYYFSSRGDHPGNDNVSLSGLMNIWLNGILGEDRFYYPKVALPESILENVGKFLAPIKKDKTFIVLINFGIGNNPNKRIPDPFEEELIKALLAIDNILILLDSGSSPAGKIKTEMLLNKAAQVTRNTDYLNEEDLAEKKLKFTEGIIGFKGSISAVGALISQADAFVGYDSCCQHLACACGTPAVIVFAGAPSSRFISRWRPECQDDYVKIIPVADGRLLDLAEKRQLAGRVISEVERIRQKRN